MIEILLAAALGLVAILIVYALFAPLPVATTLPAAPPPAQAAAVAQASVSNPFQTAGPADLAPVVMEESPDLAETSLNLKLHGTWVDESGGAAIIKTPDERQQRFSPGDEIWNGVRLDAVYRDQVVIISGGVRESLRLVNRDFSKAPRPAAEPVRPASSGRSRGGHGLGIGDAVQIIPRTTADGLKFTLQPGADAGRFAALGLRQGDVLTAIDNRRIGSNMAAELKRLEALSGRSTVSIAVERDGVTLPLEIDLTARGNAISDDD